MIGLKIPPSAGQLRAARKMLGMARIRAAALVPMSDASLARLETEGAKIATKMRVEMQLAYERLGVVFDGGEVRRTVVR